RVCGVECMLGVDERGHSAQLLRLGNHLQRQRRLARRLGAEDLDDASPRYAADAEREIDADGASRNRVDRLDGAFLTKAHDRTLTELLFDLADRQVDGFGAFAIVTVVAGVDGRHAGNSFAGRGGFFRPRKRSYSRGVPE